MINIVNKYTHQRTNYDLFCGRPSPLGNPFEIGVHGTRDEVCDQYETMLQGKYLAHGFSKGEKEMLRKIMQWHLEGKQVNLVCYCAPKRCHCDTIKKVVEQRIQDYGAILKTSA